MERRSIQVKILSLALVVNAVSVWKFQIQSDIALTAWKNPVILSKIERRTV
jgi:hypothetical protein